MARGDGIDRTSARNMRLTTQKLKNAQQHNEREKDSYVNPDIVPERSHLNVHFKKPDGNYLEQFEQMEAAGVISTRGLKEDAFRYGELVFDVNSAYFFNRGGYEFAKEFYEAAYQAAIEIVGGEQYILSAVMHADERNRAMSDALGQDVYHYHLHVVYVPVVEKQILWTKRCKDKSLVGKVKETIMQVSMSKKWASKPILDETTGEPLRTEKGKPILKKSYSVLQDDFFRYMERLAALTEQTQEKAQQAASLEKKLEKVQRQQVEVQKVEQIEVRPVPFSSKVILERSEYEALSAAAKKYCTQEHKAVGFKKALDAANKLIGELKTKVAALNAELQEYKSVRRQLNTAGLEQENAALKKKLQSYEIEIERNKLWHLFERSKAKPQKEKI